MNESLLAGRYAKALLAYAEEVGEADVLYPIMKRLSGLLRPTASLRGVLDNPTLASSVRERVVLALAGEALPESLRRFVDLVFSHNRESLVNEMARAYVRLYRRHRGVTYARVVAARELDDATRGRLVELLRQRYGGEVELDEEVDEQLLGGFILKVDGKEMDGSVRGQIERIRNVFISRNRSIV